jgi:hypothetical protein
VDGTALDCDGARVPLRLDPDCARCPPIARSDAARAPETIPERNARNPRRRHARALSSVGLTQRTARLPCDHNRAFKAHSARALRTCTCTRSTFHLVRYVDEGVTVVVLANGDDSDMAAIANGIANLYLRAASSAGSRQ